MKECEYCKGKGYVNILLNPSSFHYEMDYPEIEECVCEECGGSGTELEN